MRRLPAPISALSFTTTVGIVAFLAVLWGVDPATAGFFELAVFYGSLFVGLAGVAAFGLMYFRSNRFRKDVVSFFGTSLRQGLLCAAVAVSFLMLQDVRKLGPFTVLPLLAAAAYIEFRAIFSSRLSHIWRKNR